MMAIMSAARVAALDSAAHQSEGDQGHYQALLARDARFDGRLFVGVISTGIYCRPVCRVRTPLRRNCRFFASAPTAEVAGFRPCLRCRPELAPGLSLVDSSQALSQQAARLMEQAVADGRNIAISDLAARLGVTDRHLRRIFKQTHGVAPLDWLTTRRLLQAKQLLTDTTLPVTDVAQASGFASLRRFNAAFAERYRINPTALRRQRKVPTPDERGALVLRLAYRPPYDMDGVLRFLRARALPGVERVEGFEIWRTLAWPHAGTWLRGWLGTRFVPERHEVELSVAPSLAPVIGTLLQRQRQALDLDADPALIDAALSTLPLPCVPGLRLLGGIDSFEVAVRVILGQQVTVAAARTLTHRLVEALGEPIDTPFPGLTRLFPSASVVAAADPEVIGRLGIVRQRVRALQALATAVSSGQLELHPGVPLVPTLERLRALPGVGEWTVQLVAMRALAWPDAFPATDIAVLNALGT
ncbi:MAG: DNA-O6-methylguanine-protein-cysteine S-methyltransferase/DNA-3-methyladenine glycosylase Ada/AlkA, partial [Pseudomonadota bacterium]